MILDILFCQLSTFTATPGLSATVGGGGGSQQPVVNTVQLNFTVAEAFMKVVGRSIGCPKHLFMKDWYFNSGFFLHRPVFVFDFKSIYCIPSQGQESTNAIFSV